MRRVDQGREEKLRQDSSIDDVALVATVDDVARREGCPVELEEQKFAKDVAGESPLLAAASGSLWDASRIWERAETLTVSSFGSSQPLRTSLGSRSTDWDPRALILLAEIQVWIW